MKIGDVLRKERTGNGLSREKARSADEMAEALGMPKDEYQTIEAGESPAERWFPLLCRIAVQLKTPTSRLLTATGKSKDCERGHAGPTIRGHREERGKTVEEMAELMGLEIPEYVSIEKGESPIEEIGPTMLKFAELIDQPVFNIYHPCGVPFDQLDDYP